MAGWGEGRASGRVKDNEVPPPFSAAETESEAESQPQMPESKVMSKYILYLVLLVFRGVREGESQSSRNCWVG